jgi:hypothetical protein
VVRVLAEFLYWYRNAELLRNVYNNASTAALGGGGGIYFHLTFGGFNL